MTPEVDKEWFEFCSGTWNYDEVEKETEMKKIAPESTPLYISTKTKICHLSSSIDLEDVFWKLPMTPYSTPSTGIIKKQMKFCSASPEELRSVEDKLRQELERRPNYVNNHSITHVVNPNGMIKFKDIRKLSIGLSKKDLISNRCKKKSAFYNCFVVIIRIFYADEFKEVNVKVFNTGKLEIPGIQQDEVLTNVLEKLTEILKPIVDVPSITYSKEYDTVLINSNFKCNYFINRDKLVDILKNKYNIKCSYDPCSYPGVQCTFFYDSCQGLRTDIHTSDKNTSKVSIMIFRTGSVLIVGRCNDSILDEIYIFVRTLLKDEYNEIRDDTTPPSKLCVPTKKRLRTFYITV